MLPAKQNSDLGNYKSLFSHKIYFILQITTMAKGPSTHKKAFYFSDPPSPQPSPILDLFRKID
jgi:hypothetical protein